ncbi:hypothetical protein [Dyadobacter sp. CY347]|uniref:hypothetical protein n=1 Tax=Dyadobacter sp. CY347 TaxID=2909336 RepID=UPI001F205464|nr:hypothetical protein [Dyadobacter sp. CY347]MCF2489885.1 hypothetical protein [Dyadobacter sp. CY347]
MKKQITRTTQLFSNILIVLLLSTHAMSVAQGKFSEGYLITIQGDTIRGVIKNEDWAESPQTIKFKAVSGSLQNFSAADLQGFNIVETNEIYKSKKIGLLNISSTRRYVVTPSLEAVDSVQLFLKEVVKGKSASLYLFLNSLEQSHYFIEWNGQLKELINYDYHKVIDNKLHLLLIDEYRNQLLTFTSGLDNFNELLPLYQEKHLKEYIEKLDHVISDNSNVSLSREMPITYDLDINAGLENWKESGITLNNKFSYGLGVRINFPRKFQNRYIKVNLFLTPNLLVRYDFNAYKQVVLRTLEVAVGSHFGAGTLRPYIGFHYSGVSHGYRSDFLGFQGGISFKRRICLDIAHFINLNSVFTATGFLTRPRVALHYFFDLNFKRFRA